jgi:NAD(P)-dependent dehydrogenase (short-subunit alcohol dehydrogenase family)
MIERQIDSPVPTPVGLVVKNGLNSRSAFSAEIPTPQFLHGQAQLVCAVPARSDRQFAWPIGDRLHRFHAVDHQVDDYLLELDPRSWSTTSSAARGVHLKVEKLDVTNNGDRKKALEWGVEILVNNSGVLEGGSVLDIPGANMRNEFEVNVIGQLLLTQGIAKQIVKRGQGRIV